jgi:cellulase/cellobiase CelA1
MGGTGMTATEPKMKRFYLAAFTHPETLANVVTRVTSEG